MRALFTTRLSQAQPQEIIWRSEEITNKREEEITRGRRGVACAKASCKECAVSTSLTCHSEIFADKTSSTTVFRSFNFNRNGPETSWPVANPKCRHWRRSSKQRNKKRGPSLKRFIYVSLIGQQSRYSYAATIRNRIRGAK